MWFRLWVFRGMRMPHLCTVYFQYHMYSFTSHLEMEWELKSVPAVSVQFWTPQNHQQNWHSRVGGMETELPSCTPNARESRASSGSVWIDVCLQRCQSLAWYSLLKFYPQDKVQALQLKSDSSNPPRRELIKVECKGTACGCPCLHSSLKLPGWTSLIMCCAGLSSPKPLFAWTIFSIQTALWNTYSLF